MAADHGADATNGDPNHRFKAGGCLANQIRLSSPPAMSTEAVINTGKTSEADEPSFDWASTRADFPILDQEVHGFPLIFFME